MRTFLLVGGASAYAPGLVRALIDEANRHHLECIRLYDIAEKRLAVVARLCEKMAHASAASIRIEATTDLEHAVDDVDVLLNSSRPGGFDCRRIDEKLPLRFGVPGQETVGPGGFFFALRSIPAAFELADALRRHSPQAVWLNYTNPTNIVAQALCDETDLNVIALCDQSDEDLRAIADALGYPADVDYDFVCCGLNHATWYRDITIDNQPLDDRAFGVEPPQYYDEEHKMRFRISQKMARGEVELWPNSYLPYYRRPGAFVELFRRQGTRTEAILQNLDDYYEHFEEEADSDEPDLRHYRGSSGFGDMAADAIAALSSDSPQKMVLNVVNRGLSDEFDDATVTEAVVELSEAGVERTTSAPSVPRDALPLLEQLETYQRRTAQAAQSGTEEDLTAALSANPLVDDASMAKSMLERARSAYGDAIPQFGP